MAEVVRADSAGLRRAAALLRADGICAFPTETVYGLGANALSPTAIAEIYRLKERPAWNPLIAHAYDADHARSLARTWPDLADVLARRFWPGPLTMVVERAAHLPGILSAGSATVAIRVPAHPVARALLEECSLPLAAPSANRSECLSPTRAEHVLHSLPEVPLVLEGGSCEFGIESTVLDLTREPPRLLRPGALSLRLLREAIGPVDLTTAARDDAQIRSPGMGRRHYAPRARLVVLDELGPGVLAELKPPAAVLTYEKPDDRLTGAVSSVEILPDDPQGYAADLYAALHRLDASLVATVAVLAPPRHEDWMAIRDRLRRAAA